MRLCIITDEISQDLDHALDVCEDEGVSTVELRAVGRANIVSHDDDSVEKIKATIDSRGFRVGAIA
jgi:L-ribulose-5-phosphate 3-epimerase